MRPMTNRRYPQMLLGGVKYTLNNDDIFQEISNDRLTNYSIALSIVKELFPTGYRYSNMLVVDDWASKLQNPTG